MFVHVTYEGSDRALEKLHFVQAKMTYFGRFRGTKNGTSCVQIKILRPFSIEIPA